MSIWSQVGVGTTNPTAQLEIVSTTVGLPALELNPQATPVGTSTGQIAVIGSDLFMYDAIRAKWLSIAHTALQFGRNGNAINIQNLRFAGNVSSSVSAPLMPRKGTIVSATAITSANATKAFELRVRAYDAATNTVATVQSFSFNLSDFEYVNNTLNIDFNANEFITVRASGTDNASNPVVLLWVKWRE